MKRLKYIDKTLLVLMLIVAIFGAMMIYSASSITAIQKYQVDPGYFFYKQIVFVVIGLTAFVVTAIIPHVAYLRLGNIVYFITLGLLMLLFTMEPINNSHSWIVIAGFTIQPAEFAKVGLIMYLAGTFNNLKGNVDHWFQLAVPFALGLASIILVAGQPDLGTAMIMVFIFVIMVLASEIKWLYLLRYIAYAVAAVALLLFVDTVSPTIDILNAEQLARFDFKEPCADYHNDGYQVCNGYIAINNGGLTGLGLGNSKQKHLYLPEAHNDFIMPIIIEELGFLGGVAIIAAYAFMFFRILSIALKASDLFGTLLCLGSGAFLLGHILVNLGGIFGIMPMTGVPLPFLSAGGSNVIAIFISLGLVQSVAIRNNIIQSEQV